MQQVAELAAARSASAYRSEAVGSEAARSAVQKWGSVERRLRSQPTREPQQRYTLAKRRSSCSSKSSLCLCSRFELYLMHSHSSWLQQLFPGPESSLVYAHLLYQVLDESNAHSPGLCSSCLFLNTKPLSCLWRLYRNSDATVLLDRESGSLV